MAEATTRARRARGDARPYWSEDRQRFELKVELPSADGKRRRRKITGRTEAECIARAAELRTQLATTGQVDSTTATVNDALDGFLANVVAKKKPSTQGTYRRWVRLYVRPHIGRKRLARLTPGDVTAWLTLLQDSGGEGGKALSAGTVRAARNRLSATLRWAQNEGLVRQNVASVAFMPEVDQSSIELDDEDDEPDKMWVLDLPEVTALLAECSDWSHRAGVVVMVNCGLRIGELLGLQWRDIDMETGRTKLRRQLIYIAGDPDEGTKDVLTLVPYTKGKGRRRREIDLPDNALRALAEHRRTMLASRMADGVGAPLPDALVFPSSWGTPMCPRNWARELGKRSTRAGIGRVNPHVLRHTAASLLLNAGVSMSVVSLMLGHASERTTSDTYSWLLDSGRSSAAAAMDAMFG